MKKSSKIFIAGHNGLVGSAIRRCLVKKGYSNLICIPHSELDLERQKDVEDFFKSEKPEYVFLAAAKVGGIFSNNSYPAEFIYSNLVIQVNVIETSYKTGVKKLLFLGSSCIYPRLAPQPIKEEYLLTSPLESTNEAYAIAKIAGLKMCKYYNKQYGTNYISVMPTNLYGPNDNYDFNNSHVLPALLRKIYLARCCELNDFDSIISDIKKRGYDDSTDNLKEKFDIVKVLKKIGINKENGRVSLSLWGSGLPKREFLHVDDFADAAVILMEKYNYNKSEEIINIGFGSDISISELAEIIRGIVGFKGKIIWDSSKPDGTPRKLLDINRIKRIGWNPKITLDTGIKNVFKEYLKYNHS